MKKISNKELNKRDNWIITELHHERYTFNIETSIYEDKTILEILDDLGYWGLENKIEKYDNQEVYLLDEIYHEESESDTWCLTEKERKRFLPLNISAVMIMSLKDFKREKGFSGCFGSTNRKYGVMDYAITPVKMEENKND